MTALNTYRFFTIVIFLACVSNKVEGQMFTFSDTYPVNNVDSIEQWIANNSPPSVERLKNLIRLERTYRFGYVEKLGQALPEIKQLADALKSQTGQACYFYLSSVARSEERQQAFENNNKAFDIFVSQNDTSGMIHVLAKLATDNYNSAGYEIGHKSFSEAYIKRAESLLAQRFNPHDFIPIGVAVFYRIYGQEPVDGEKMLAHTQQMLSEILKYPECKYAIGLINTRVAIANYWLKNYAESYRINKEVLKLLKPNQVAERVRVMLNAANDCEFLEKYEERIKICHEAQQIMLQNKYQNWHYAETIFISLKEEMYRKGNYKLAAEYSDSLLVVHDSLYFTQRDQKFLELESQYQAVEKQKQIVELTLKQKENESRNRFILTISFAILLVSVVLGLLWAQLRQKNKLLFEANEQLQAHTRTREQFFAIIAHDLRRPFLAFQGMSELVSFYLKKGDYSAIQKISQSIDESGLRIRQLLDNLLKWALSQKEEVPYAPQRTNLLSEIQSTVKIYESAYAYQAIKFDVDCAQNIIVFVDRNALELILRNLINNALSAVSNDKGLISISARTNADKVMLSVMDNGKGLDDVKIAAIRRVLANPNMGEAGQNGLGFGLILISKFTKRNNIYVNVKSKLGEGTCFELLLPTL